MRQMDKRAVCKCSPVEIDTFNNENVVVLPIFYSWPHFLRTAIELINSELKTGNKVLVLYPCTKIKLLTNSYSGCEFIKARIGLKTNIGKLINLFDNKKDIYFYKICNQSLQEESLKVQKLISNNYILTRLDSNSMGKSILSELIDKYGGDDDENFMWKSFIVSKYVNQYKIMQESVLKLLRPIKIKKLYIFNGRFLFDSIFEDYSLKINNEIFYYENGGEKKDFDLFSHKSQDLTALISRIESLTKNLTDIETAQGLDWFEKRIRESNKVKRIFHQYYLDILAKKKHKIIFFVSSINEWAIVGKKWNKFFSNQHEAISYLASQFNPEEYTILVRDHPNMNKRPRFERKLNRKKMKKIGNVKIIARIPFLCSYELVRQADIIATYGSTIGLEAIYMKKIPITMGASIYQKKDPKNLSISSLMEINHTSPEYLAAYGLFASYRGFFYRDINSLKTSKEFKNLIHPSNFYRYLCFMSSLLIKKYDQIIYKIRT